MSKFGEEPYELQTATATAVTTATCATTATGATTGKVHAASPTCCLLSIDEVEVEVEVEGLLKASVGKEVVTAEAQDSQQVRVDALDS